MSRRGIIAWPRETWIKQGGLDHRDGIFVSRVNRLAGMDAGRHAEFVHKGREVRLHGENYVDQTSQTAEIAPLLESLKLDAGARHRAKPPIGVCTSKFDLMS